VVSAAAVAHKVWQLPLVLGLCVLVLLGASLNFISERKTQAIATDPGTIDPAELPLLDEPLLIAAHTSASSATAIKYLDAYLVRRPLFAPAWLSRAEQYLRMGDTKAAMADAAIAQDLWRARPKHLWRLVNFYIQLGDDSQALDTLERYLVAKPTDLKRVLATARRLEASPKVLAVRFSNALGENADHKGVVNHAQRLLAFAHTTADADLARAFWAEIPQSTHQHKKVAYRFIDAMLEAGDNALATQAWAEFSGTPVELGEVVNGDFEKPLANGGLGWRFPRVDGASLDIDSRLSWTGEQSLVLHFEGTHNLNFYHLWQRIPVRPDTRYRITGWWRGQNISTRSGVYLEAFTQSPRVHTRTSAERTSWPWSEFAMELHTPPEATHLSLRLRRNQTDALDNLIFGTVWLDDLRMSEIKASHTDG
jgi:tetratricopeptide (TPR) repeat protein